MIDQARLGAFVAEFMEQLEREHADDEIELGTMMLVLELAVADGTEFGSTLIRFRCSDPRGWVQRGLLTEAIEASQGDRDYGDELEDGEP